MMIPFVGHSACCYDLGQLGLSMMWSHTDILRIIINQSTLRIHLQWLSFITVKLKSNFNKEGLAYTRL